MPGSGQKKRANARFFLNPLPEISVDVASDEARDLRRLNV